MDLCEWDGMGVKRKKGNTTAWQCQERQLYRVYAMSVWIERAVIGLIAVIGHAVHAVPHVSVERAVIAPFYLLMFVEAQYVSLKVSFDTCACLF